MRQANHEWQVPNFPIAMEWFEQLPKKGTTGYTSTDKLEAPFILAPMEDGTCQFSRFHLRHSNRANGGREARPSRQAHLERLHREYQWAHKDSKSLVTLPPEVQWAFGLTVREHLLMILLWVRRDADARTGRRVLSGSNYFVTSLMRRLCGRSNGKWKDSIKGLQDKALIDDWHLTKNPLAPRFRLFHWSFGDDVLQRIREFYVPPWARPPAQRVFAAPPSTRDKELHQDTKTCTGTPALGHSATCTGTPGPAPGHQKPAPGQHRLSDLDDLADLIDPSGPPLTDEPPGGSSAAPRGSGAKNHVACDPSSGPKRMSPPFEDLRGDTFLVPPDFELPTESAPSMSAPSKVLGEVVAVLHDRCDANAQKKVVELIDGSWREKPRVPSKQWIRREALKRCPGVLVILEDDEVRRLTLSRLQGKESRYKVVDILDDLDEWVMEDADRIENGRHAAREALQTQRREDEQLLVSLRENGLTTFSDLVRIEPDAEESNCRRVGWEMSAPESSWLHRSPQVMAAMRVTGVRSPESVRVDPPDLAQLIIDANPEALSALLVRREQVDREAAITFAKAFQEERQFILKWVPEAADLSDSDWATQVHGLKREAQRRKLEHTRSAPAQEPKERPRDVAMELLIARLTSHALG